VLFGGVEMKGWGEKSAALLAVTPVWSIPLQQKRRGEALRRGVVRRLRAKTQASGPSALRQPMICLPQADNEAESATERRSNRYAWGEKLIPRYEWHSVCTSCRIFSYLSEVGRWTRAEP
jgi:hypothetical protein